MSAHQPIDAVAVFAPWCDDAERALRIRIHKARDTATARGSRSRHGRARVLYWWAADLASDSVFARMEFEALDQIVKALTYAFLAAGVIERAEAPDDK